MRERRYFVIEADAGAPPPLIAPGPRRTTRGPSMSDGVPSRPAPASLRIESMTEGQAADARRSEKVRVVGEPMPIALIQPHARGTDDGRGAADSGQGDAWGIAATAADVSARDGAGVSIAVLDTGIDLDHPAFVAIRDRIEVKDFTRNSTDAGDRDGHGTHCAGTIFGQDVDGRRIGIARGIDRALIAKVFDDKDESETTALFDAMTWAQRGGADIISMSLGFDFPAMTKRLIEWYDLAPEVAASQTLVAFAANLRAFDTLVAAMQAQALFGGGSLIVAASGNESDHSRGASHLLSASLPSASLGVIPVGAYGPDNAGYIVADFSNIDVQICAPGVDILSARAGTRDLVPMSGTSMACPHVAGLAALWWQEVAEKQRNPTPDKVREQLFVAATRNRLPAPYTEAHYGRGRALAP